MSKVKEVDRWAAVRRGPIYCAPACGGGCKWSAYQKAVRDAGNLALKLGMGWRPIVHENLGWHWTVVYGDPVSGFGAGLIEIRHYAEEGYTATLQTTPQLFFEHKDPKKLVLLVKAGIAERVAYWDDQSKRLREVAAGMPR